MLAIHKIISNFGEEVIADISKYRCNVLCF